MGFFGARKVAREQADELDRLRGEMTRLGAFDAVELQREKERLQGEVEDLKRHFSEEKTRLDHELFALRQRVAVTQEEEILQEVGIYTYRHPLDDSSRTGNN